MSRHDFEADGVKLAIGWDAPLATYYLQIWTGDETDEDEGPTIWLGASYAEAPFPDPLLVVARRYMPSLPSTIGRQLTVDSLREGARPRRPGLIDPG